MPVNVPTGLDSATRFCAVFGHPIRHSASPAMHNAALRHLGLNWSYAAFEVLPENLGSAMAGARAMGFIGLNLTVPHKILALDLVDAIDPQARFWGAVNTIVFQGRQKDGAWKGVGGLNEPCSELRSYGLNTDADALSRSLREDLAFEPRESTVLLLGAGGAGRTAALKLAQDGVRELYLVNRTVSKAQELQGEIQAAFPTVKVFIGYPPRTVDLVLNATSLGLRPADPLPWDVSGFPLSRATHAYDMIYRPAETAFLREAKTAGLKAVNGLGMLLYQGAAALEAWTGQEAPVTVMRSALMENVYGSTGQPQPRQAGAPQKL